MATTKTLEGPIIQVASGRYYIPQIGWNDMGLYLTYIIESQNRTAGTTTIKYSLFDSPFRIDNVAAFNYAPGDPVYAGIYERLPAAISYWYTNPVTENTFHTSINPMLHDMGAVVTEVFNGGNSIYCRRWLLEDITLIVNDLESYDLNVNMTDWLSNNINTNITIGLADYGIITMAPTAFTDAAKPTVQYVNPRGEEVSVLQMGIARTDNDAMIVPYRDVSKANSSSYTFNFTADELNAFYSFLNTTTSGSVYFALRSTVDGKTNVSSSYATVSLVDYSPVLSPIIEDINTQTLALTGNASTFVKYYSTARFAVNATARKGAGIVSHYTTHNNAIYRNATGTVNNIEQTKFTLSATDSRNITSSTTVNVSMLDYIKLTCNLSAGLPTTDDKIPLTVTGNFWNNSFGAVRNTIRIQYRYKSNTSSTFSSWAIGVGEGYPSSGNTYTYSFDISVPNHVDNYTVQVRAIDKLATIESRTVSVQAYPIFDWDADDFNFNVPVNIQNNLYVAGDIHQNGVPVTDFIVEQGTKTTGSGNSQANWVYRKWNSGIAECWCRKHVSTAVNTSWGSLYVSGALSYTNITWGVSFTDIPVANITIAPHASGAFLIAGGSTSLTKTNTGGYEIARGSALASAGNFYINYYAIGTWK